MKDLVHRERDWMPRPKRHYDLPFPLFSSVGVRFAISFWGVITNHNQSSLRTLLTVSLNKRSKLIVFSQPIGHSIKMASLFKGRWAGSSPIGHSIKMASMFKGRWAGRSIVSFPVVAALLLLLMFHVVPTQQQQAAQALSSSCHVLSLIPFNTVPGGFNSGVWPVERVAKLGYTHLAAALLAVQHFNTRNGAIVPELEDLEDSGCNVTIDLSVINTEMEASSISRQVMDLVSSREVATNDDEENALCASVGGIDQTAAQAMQYFAIGLGAPNIHTAYFDETAVHWRRKDLQSLTLYTTVEYTARQMLQHLGDLGRSHLAVVYTPEPEGRHMAEFLRDAYGDYPDIEKVRTFSAAGPPGKPPSREILETMFNDIQETGFTTLILLDPRTCKFSHGGWLCNPFA